MIEQSYDDLTLLKFESLVAAPGLVHAVTTRPQNYAPHRGQGSEEAVAWRRRVCGVLGVEFDRLTSPAQVHSADVLAVEEQDIGCGREGRAGAVQQVDGLLTDRPGLPLILLSADCPLVCVFDPVRPAIGAVHASWKGTVAGAANQLVRRMQIEFGSDPARLMAAIAPSAGPCCYEVGPEVYRVACTRLSDPASCFSDNVGRSCFNLWEANRRQLVEAGVRPEDIEVAGICTICDERFWSHRRDGPQAGRFALFISLV